MVIKGSNFKSMVQYFNKLIGTAEHRNESKIRLTIQNKKLQAMVLSVQAKNKVAFLYHIPLEKADEVLEPMIFDFNEFFSFSKKIKAKDMVTFFGGKNEIVLTINQETPQTIVALQKSTNREQSIQLLGELDESFLELGIMNFPILKSSGKIDYVNQAYFHFLPNKLEVMHGNLFSQEISQVSSASPEESFMAFPEAYGTFLLNWLGTNVKHRLEMTSTVSVNRINENSIQFTLGNYAIRFLTTSDTDEARKCFSFQKEIFRTLHKKPMKQVSYDESKLESNQDEEKSEVMQLVENKDLESINLEWLNISNYYMDRMQAKAFLKVLLSMDEKPQIYLGSCETCSFLYYQNYDENVYRNMVFLLTAHQKIVEENKKSEEIDDSNVN